MKYLITQQLKDAIVWMLPDATPIKEIVSELKPIEPLSDEVIEQMWSDAWESVAEGWVLPVFARAIEAHILGEKP